MQSKTEALPWFYTVAFLIPTMFHQLLQVKFHPCSFTAVILWYICLIFFVNKKIVPPYNNIMLLSKLVIVPCMTLVSSPEVLPGGTQTAYHEGSSRGEKNCGN